jgi:hypothetical protein
LRADQRKEPLASRIFVLRTRNALSDGGVRWSTAGSQNMLSPPVAWLSDDWNRLWATRRAARAA